MLFTAVVALLVAAVNGANTLAPIAAPLPVVDLRYERYRAWSLDTKTQIYTFRNIRFAAPPVGNLRFAPPQPPLKNRTEVQSGKYGRKCLQASPLWEINLGFGNDNDGASEDCLFLNVIVPKKVFEGKKKAPVIVWIFGGGYIGGMKDDTNANGLLDFSDDSVIYVAMNYRLGALGFTSGPSFQASGGLANAGLHDQRFALEWIQQNIHLFNGDKDTVTVMGESAGGGSIVHHITAWGGAKGSGKTPFKRAIAQSPGFLPVGTNYYQEEMYVKFLKAAGCIDKNADFVAGLGAVENGLACLRKKPMKVLQDANTKVISDAPYGSFNYGPVVDGTYVPALPSSLLSQGAFDKSVSVLIGHNANEGFVFTNPKIQNETTFHDFLKEMLPYTPNRIINYIDTHVYPTPSKKTIYSNHRERASLLISEAAFTCYTMVLARAFGNKTNNYLFDVFPAWHGMDVKYTFYDGGKDEGGMFNATIARYMQDYILDFAKNGKVNDEKKKGRVPYFPLYGSKSTILDLDSNGVVGMVDPTANDRCRWWQKGLVL